MFPPEKSRDDIEKSQNADFQRSEDNAEHAALNYLQIWAVTAERINDQVRRVGKLQPGDALDAVNGVKTHHRGLHEVAEGHQARR